MALVRREALKEAIISCIRDIVQCEEAHKLMETCGNLNSTGKTTESILSEFTQLVISKAIEKKIEWLQEHDMSEILDSIDHYAALAPAMEATMNGDVTFPNKLIPELKLTEELIAQKEKEIDKLQQIVSEKQATLAEMNREIDEEANKTQDLMNDIDESFKHCLQELQNHSRAINPL